MEMDGIMNACTTKLVPNNARITVTCSDSRYSVSVVWFALDSSAGTGFAALPLPFLLPKPPVPAPALHPASGLASSSNLAFARHQFLQGAPGRFLFRFLLRASLPAGHALAFDPHFHQKRFLMVGAAFTR